MKPRKPLKRTEFKRKPLKAKSVQLRQGSALKASRKPIQLQSKKRRQEAPGRDAVRKLTAERAGGRCEVAGRLPGPCWGPFDVHELLSRARSGGTSHMDASLTALLCRGHHTTVTENPALAESLGLSLPSGPCLKSKLLYEREAG